MPFIAKLMIISENLAITRPHFRQEKKWVESSSIISEVKQSTRNEFFLSTFFPLLSPSCILCFIFSLSLLDAPQPLDGQRDLFGQPAVHPTGPPPTATVRFCLHAAGGALLRRPPDSHQRLHTVARTRIAQFSTATADGTRTDP